ncbi:MAG TPA: DALR anticodon-binding domain-containing protein, partial [Gaiellaceae bacterium]|nr:DALR anticodon-binding domain-containing protein [Gaiellaceae bacterium]
VIAVAERGTMFFPGAAVYMEKIAVGPRGIDVIDINASPTRNVQAVAEATERRAPHAIPTYAIRVADDFHRFYHEHRVLDSEQQAFRLTLCRATQAVIARCLDLVGVEAPERM